MIINRYFGRTICNWLEIESRAAKQALDFLSTTGIISPQDRHKDNKDYRRIYNHFMVKCLCDYISECKVEYPVSFIAPLECKGDVDVAKRILPFIPVHFAPSYDEFVRSCETNGNYIEMLSGDNIKKRKANFKRAIRIADGLNLKWLSETYFRTIEARCLVLKT